MIRDFEQIKVQLQELSTIINAFKSEAVQLRIVELMFEAGGSNEESADPHIEPDEVVSTRPRRRKRKIAKVDDPSTMLKKNSQFSKKTSGRPGPGAMIQQLKESGFFKAKRTVNEIREHCQKNLAYGYGTNELAPSLGRAVRNLSLKREQNADGQYEYSED